MDSKNIHIDPATFKFPDPPVNSLEKDSSQLTDPQRHFPIGLEPRSAGFSYGYQIDHKNWWGEFADARRLNNQICLELAKGPPSATLDENPPPECRKRSLKTIFRSRSNRKSSSEKKKMPVATLQTSDGCKYGQILSGQIYDGSCNASTYQINESRRPLNPRANEGQQMNPKASFEIVGDVNPVFHHANGTKRPVGERSAHKSSKSGEARPQLPPCSTISYSEATANSLENRILTDRPINGNTVAGRIDPNRPKPLNGIASLQSSPRKSTTDDSLGLLRDLSQILSRGDTTVLTAGASQIPGPETEHRPRVRDFAADGSAPFSRARAAIRRRSRSPAKKGGKHAEAPVTPDRSLNAVTYDCQPTNSPGPNCIILPPTGFKEQARPPLAPPLATNPEQVSGTKTSPVRHYHSKAPSAVSAESTAEDLQSDASSGVISNAQSAVFVKIPPQPGPAPLTPLPSLPEGLDKFVPETPRASQSSQRLASPESSPSKVPPPKSPARSQYRLYPSVDNSPPKRPSSPIRLNAATDSEQVVPHPSPPLRSKRRGISFPRSDHLATSMSVGTLDELEQWKKERSENSRQTKIRDLARVGSHKATIEEVEPVTRKAVNGERYHEGAAELPSPGDSCSPALFLLKHRPQASQFSDLTAKATLQYRDSSTLPQKLSPIIVVAEQAPVSPVQRTPSQKSQSNGKSVEDQPRGFRTNGFYPVPPHLASPALQGPEDDNRIRPVSSHSLPIPRPVASRTPTPHPSPLLRGPSRRSSHHSSLQETSGLERRLSAMERKNAMLERALLAVLNTPVAFSGSVGLNGMEGASGDGSSGLSGKDCDRSSGTSGTSGTESLYAGLENLLAQHKCSAGVRWSTSSGP